MEIRLHSAVIVLYALFAEFVEAVFNVKRIVVDEKADVTPENLFDYLMNLVKGENDLGFVTNMSGAADGFEVRESWRVKGGNTWYDRVD